MKKILVISYYFPPCTLTASNRILSWANHLHAFGYYPIIITRKWEKDVLRLEDMSHSTSPKIEILKNEFYEVHYLPYKGSLKDRLYESGKVPMIRKMLSFYELVANNFTLRTLPYKNIYDHSRNIIKSNNIKNVLISGAPFQLFHFGYKLKREFDYIKWIADYRDDWNTSDIFINKGILKQLVVKLESKSEKRWLSNVDSIISISDYYSEKIGDFLNKPHHTIYNGFEKIIDYKKDLTYRDEFKILYNGSLYSTQPVEKFILMLNNIQEKINSKIKIHLQFIGVGIDEVQENRILKLVPKVNYKITTTARINKNEVLNKQIQADLLLMISHEGLKGIPSSKVFEYLSLKKQFLVFPNDFDILEKISLESDLGIIVTDVDELLSAMNKFIEIKHSTTKELSVDTKKINKFSVINQVEKLSKLLN